jgi:hypothetical protein
MAAFLQQRYSNQLIILPARSPAAPRRPPLTVTLPATQRDAVQSIQLPIYGDPIRYPFDRYRLGLGIIIDRLFPDGSVQTLSPEQARAYAGVTLQARIPRTVMHDPVILDPAQLQARGATDPYLVVVILVLLGTITVRTVYLLDDRSVIRFLNRRPHAPHDRAEAEGVMIARHAKVRCPTLRHEAQLGAAAAEGRRGAAPPMPHAVLATRAAPSGAA